MIYLELPSWWWLSRDLHLDFSDFKLPVFHHVSCCHSSLNIGWFLGRKPQLDPSKGDRPRRLSVYAWITVPAVSFWVTLFLCSCLWALGVEDILWPHSSARALVPKCWCTYASSGGTRGWVVQVGPSDLNFFSYLHFSSTLSLNRETWKTQEYPVCLFCPKWRVEKSQVLENKPWVNFCPFFM